MKRLNINKIFGYDFNNKYSCDEKGSIYNTKSGMLLKGFPDGRRGYLKVKLYDVDGKGVTLFIHRIICRMFHGEAPEGKPQVNHDNGDKLDNAASNLYWISSLNNVRHSIDNKLSPSRSMQLSEDKVHDICKLLFVDKMRNIHVSRKLNIPKTTIEKIKAGKNYKRISEQYK